MNQQRVVVHTPEAYDWYMVWIVLSKQSLGNEREAVVGTAKKAQCGWLVKTDVGGKTQKLRREITDM